MQLKGFWRKKNKKQEKPLIALCPGVTLVDEIVMGDVTPGQDALVKGLSEALILFGSMGGFLSCIGASFYVPVVALAYILLAAYFSYLFKSGKIWVRDLGYLVFFAVFVLGIILLREYVNSGFYAIVNLIYDMASNYFDMPAVREFTEIIANRDLTITVAVIFIGSAEIIILNIYLSTYMSILAAVMVSVPIFTVPLFFEREPDSFYMILLFAGLASVIVQKGNGHYAKNKDNTQFTYFTKKKRKRFSYTQSGLAVAEIILGLAIICILTISMCNIIYPKESFAYRYKTSTLKASIEDPVENVMLTGLAGLFNFYGSTGGMNGGKLGGVSSIRANYQPDLEVRFTPYSYDAVYLKGFTGEYYDKDHWTKDDNGLFETVSDADAKGVMRVRNVGADAGYLYMPYYTEMEDTALLRYQNEEGVKLWETETYTYYPDLSMGALAEADTDKIQIRFSDEKGIKFSYFDVPEENYDTISKFCESAGFGGSDEEIISQVIGYFQDNIPYTLRPGAMPRNADFVNYFLEKNRKGYCAHFASAATLIFRYYGMPARYVEGYVIPYAQIIDGELVEGAEYSDYYTGQTGELGETAVVDVTVTDANAHAWVEVYKDGAWQVVEVTPASNEDETEDFWSVFGDLLNGNQDSEGTEGQSSGNVFSLDRLKWMWVVILGGAAAFILFYVMRFCWKKGHRIFSYHKKDMIENVVAYYRYMCECMRAVEPNFYQADSHLAQLAYMMPEADETTKSRIAKQLEQISYSQSVQDVNAGEILSKLKAVLKERRHGYNLMTRWYLFMHV